MWRWADGSEMESSQKPPNSFRLTALRRRLNVLCAKGKLMSTPYNLAFACLECCKSFKREYKLIQKGYPSELYCPNCGGIAYNLGRHFKAPKKTDNKQWDKIRFLVKNGFRFQKIRIGTGHHDTVSYPETLEEAKEFVVKYKDYAIKN